MIIWTRAEQFWDEDAELFAQIKENEYMRIACTYLEKITNPDWSEVKNLDPKKKRLWVFTSKFAVSCFFQSKEKDLLKPEDAVIAVGLATKEKLRQEKIHSQIISDPQKGSKNILPVLLKEYSHESFALIYPSALKKSFDLTTELQKQKWQAINIDLYLTKIGTNLNPDKVKAIAKDLPNQTQICFASSSAVSGFWQSFAFCNEIWQAKCTAVCIGESTYKQAKSFFTHRKMSAKASLKTLLSSSRE